MENKIRLTILFLLFVFISHASDEATEISGNVYDKDTNEPIPFVNVWVKGTTRGTITDIDGHFLLSATNGDDISFSSVGYQKQELKVTAQLEMPLKIYLAPDVQQISEIKVRPEESRAKVLYRKIMEHKKENRDKVENYNDYKAFERTSVYMAIDSTSKVNRIIPNMNEVTMKLDDRDIRFSPIYMAELATLTSNNKDSVVYDKKDGIFPKLNQTIESLILLNVVIDLDFYKDQINILGRGIVSPLSNSARLHYDLYLNDSTRIDSVWHYNFSFTPKNKYNPLFTGRFTVEGKNFALTSIYAYVQEEANINFVNGYRSNVQYKKDENGTWFYDNQQISLNLSLTLNKDTVSRYGSQRIDQISSGNWMVNKITQYSTSEHLDQIRGYNWRSQPEFATSLMSDGTYERVDKLKENQVVKGIDAVGGMVLTSYVDLGKIELGPVFDIYSTNAIEGQRFSLPFRTGQKMWERFTVGGFLGYGTRNKELKYGLNFGWQLTQDDKFILRGNYSDDYNLVSQDKYLRFIKKNPNTRGNGNFIAAITSREENPYLQQEKKAHINLEYNTDNVILEGGAYFSSNHSTPSIHYVNNGVDYKHYSAYGALFNARLAFGQYYDQYYFMRVYYIDQTPVINLSWDIGQAYVPGDNTPDFGMYSHFHGSVVGKVNWGPTFMRYMVNGGYLFGDAPYDLLDMPVGSQSLGFAKYRFNLLHQASFAHNVYTNVHLDWVGGGIIFNKIPLFNRLKLREMVSLKAHYGDRTSAYNPIFDLPEAFTQDLTHPYAELGLGITNIFKVLRVEYIHQLGGTYMDRSFTDNSGIRFRAEMSF
ncbi:DUF5686 and carboxypeptidase-like regulatory domain-containing protein [Draconibacterium sediminis]|uniref:Carboxypeptidase-like regulatory domain-containing protein n=1 Tax=Draconibacterium sediminis TaxID=1544798 RepID=A0A0D8JDM5_9BACT|nr:DUF5686 and carboxypeptidase-like regulatory domain-containing protein [Draconibacterium sediminis]KJF43928.1 hypothetical protein LH29_12775 [Draconibacterium sediminis]